MTNAVATAVMRFGHGFMVAFLERFDDEYRRIPEGSVLLRDSFFMPDKLLKHGGIDPLIRGAIGTPVKDIRSDGMVNRELTDHLFPNMNRIPLDLAAMNIQRGRDHGLPPYNAYRELCGLERLNTWIQFTRESRDARVVDRLARLYGHPDNLDLWVGGMLEKPLRGAKIGRTFTCLLADQFRRIREGDRFWYENGDIMGKLQRQAIDSYSLSKLLCNNMDGQRRIPENAFVFYHLGTRQYKHCRDLPDLDLNPWKSTKDGFAGTIECFSSDCTCQYRIGVWSECDLTQNRQFRTDSLVVGKHPLCTSVQTVGRSCTFSGIFNKNSRRESIVTHTVIGGATRSDRLRRGHYTYAKFRWEPSERN